MKSFLLMALAFTACSTAPKSDLAANVISADRNITNITRQGRLHITNSSDSKRLKNADLVLDFSDCKKSNVDPKYSRKTCMVQDISNARAIFWPNYSSPRHNAESLFNAFLTLDSIYPQLSFNTDWFEAANDDQITQEIVNLFKFYQEKNPSIYFADGTKLTVRNVVYIN